MANDVEIQPGDIIFAHSKGVISRAIRIGEWLRWRKGSHYNHVAIVDRVVKDVVYVIQAESRGVTGKNHFQRTLDQVCPGGEYTVMKPPSRVSRVKILSFAREQVGSKYGFFTIASLVINIITPQWMTFRWSDSWICSAVTGEALRYAGWLHQWPDVYQVTPAQLYLALKKDTLK